jgi:hypothetical protein
MSVDGINVVTGETAGWDQRGYVFAPGEADDIAGWRKSQAQIAAFEFAALRDSYAARTGRPDQVGVIGVALFREARHPLLSRQAPTPDSAENSGAGAPEAPPAGARPRSRAQDQAAAERAQERDRLGTAHGGSEDSWVATTTFERAQSTPDEVITIRYDRRESLVALGVIAPVDPEAFPASALGFVPDPPAR